MAKGSSNKRRHVRLPAAGSEAAKFSGASAGELPERATVADVSEGGVGLVFSWTEGEFPLQSGDGLSFRLKLEGTRRSFEVMSVVRHVASDPVKKSVVAGVQFSGLESGLREALKGAVLSLAVTALRSWKGGAGSGPPDVNAALAAGGARRRKLYLGEILVKQGILDDERLERFLSEEYTGKARLGEELTEQGLVGEEAVARALAEQARLTYVDLNREALDLGLVTDLPRDLFTKHNCLPLREEDGVLVVVMSTPPDLAVFEELKTTLGRRVRVAIASGSRVDEWLKRAYNLEGPPRATNLRFRVQLHVEYRFLTSDWKKPVDSRPSVGLTSEISNNGMVIAGPIPPEMSYERIRGEGLKMAVRASGPELSAPMAMGCTPLRVQRTEYKDEYSIECRIDKFPKHGELAWSRLCMVRGTLRFHPGTLG
jgi:hypothetical protein